MMVLGRFGRRTPSLSQELFSSPRYNEPPDDSSKFARMYLQEFWIFSPEYDALLCRRASKGRGSLLFSFSQSIQVSIL